MYVNAGVCAGGGLGGVSWAAAPYKQTEKGRVGGHNTYYAKLSYPAIDVLIDERVLGQI